jgi:glycosyltransferase involved in cell wall biosynthesis
VKVALVHDFLLDVRGAERVFLAMCDIWPDADLFTAVYDEKGTEGRFSHRRVNASFLQKLRPTARSFRALLPLYPFAIESLDLREYDLVVSSSSAWAHGVIVGEDATHVCYCHNPFRYAWSEREATIGARRSVVRPFLSALFSVWRHWDWVSAQHVDRYVAVSDTTRRRIERFWGRRATVVHPPVETSRFTPVPAAERGDHYMVLGELMPHKRVAVAVEAFNRLRLPLVVVGDGPELRSLTRMAGPTIRFEGRVDDARVADLLARSRALVVTATEEFGIAAVEAQAAGRPVIAIAEGGLLETVIPGETGTFYEPLNSEALAQAVLEFDDEAIDPAACARSAERFSVAAFRPRLLEQVDLARRQRERDVPIRAGRRPLRPVPGAPVRR